MHANLVFLFDFVFREIQNQNFIEWKVRERIVQDGLRMPLPQGIPRGLDAVRTLLATAWDLDPDRRPSFAEIVSELSKMLGMHDTTEETAFKPTVTYSLHLSYGTIPYFASMHLFCEGVG